MPLLTEAETTRIAEAVAAAELKSGGEIATAIIAESDDYGLREVVFALTIGVVVWAASIVATGAISGLFDRVFWSWEPWYLSAAQGLAGLVAGVAAYLVAQIPAVDRLIVPRSVMAEAVARRARRHFMESGVYDTVDRTGVLIFVSELERRVELIADRGINEQVDATVWQSIVSDLTAGIRAGRSAEALATAVARCGDTLEGRVVRRGDDTNELPDHPDQLERGS